MAPNKLYHMVVEQDEDGVLVGGVPELPGCHTQAKDMRALEHRMKEAIELYLEAHASRRANARAPRFVGVHTVEV